MQNVHFKAQIDKERHLKIRIRAEQEMLKGWGQKYAFNQRNGIPRSLFFKALINLFFNSIFQFQNCFITILYYKCNTQTWLKKSPRTPQIKIKTPSVLIPSVPLHMFNHQSSSCFLHKLPRTLFSYTNTHIVCFGPFWRNKSMCSNHRII